MIHLILKNVVWQENLSFLHDYFPFVLMKGDDFLTNFDLTFREVIYPRNVIFM